MKRESEPPQPGEPSGASGDIDDLTPPVQEGPPPPPPQPITGEIYGHDD